MFGLSGKGTGQNRMEIFTNINTALDRHTASRPIKYDIRTGDTGGTLLITQPQGSNWLPSSSIGEKKKSSFRSKGDFDEYLHGKYERRRHNAAGGFNKEPRRSGGEVQAAAKENAYQLSTYKF